MNEEGSDKRLVELMEQFFGNEKAARFLYDLMINSFAARVKASALEEIMIKKGLLEEIELQEYIDDLSDELWSKYVENIFLKFGKDG